MFTRLLAYTASRNSYKFRQHFMVTQQHAALKKVAVVRTQFLHVKVSDVDAGLNSQREANRRKYLPEVNQDLDATRSQRSAIRRNRLGRRTIVPQEAAPELAAEDDAENVTAAAKDEHNTDPDLFGNSPKNPLPEDEGDKAEEEYISQPTRRSKQLRTKEYAQMIKEHFNNHRVNEALNVLEIRMLKEDRVKPENYIYNLLISGCAKAGYTRKAFHLFTKMRQRGLKVKESTYTSLFNACANAPSRLDGLTTAKRLRDSLIDKDYAPNVVNYNAMIKAFGRWGDVQTAYILADEMVDKKLVMTGETYNFLLQACASDADLGFRHSLLTWHKMLAQGLQPDYYTFNTILRCTRDCGFGDLESMEGVLNQILSGNQFLKFASTKSEKSNKNSEDSSTVKAEENEANPSAVAAINDKTTSNSLQIESNAASMELPNLLAPQPHLGSMVSLAEVTKPHERFLLLGGLHGFLQLMKSKNVTPDIQTFTTMLEVIPPTNTAEKQVLMYIRKIGLKADIDFFNILIKKRAMRFDYDGGKEVLSMIRTAGLYPDIVTYGVLALGCTTVEASRELLLQMRQHNIRMNIQILGAMLRQGTYHKSFPYICEIMQISLDEHIKPNDIFLSHLHKFYMQCARAIDARHKFTKYALFKKEHRQFCDKYRLYQEEHRIDGIKLKDAIQKIRERPYAQYKEEPIDGVEPIKNEKLARKTKLRKHIKKIKLQTLKGDGNDEDSLKEVTRHFEKVTPTIKEVTQISPPSNKNNPFKIS